MKRYVRKAAEAKAMINNNKAKGEKTMAKKNVVVKAKDSVKVVDNGTVYVDVVYERDSKNSHRYIISEPQGVRFFQRTIYFDKGMEIPKEIVLRMKVNA